MRAMYRRSWFGRPSKASNGRILLVQVLLFLLAASAVVGARAYVLDSREEDRETAARLASEAQYYAEFASYENARDERDRCIASAETREVTRELDIAKVSFVDRKLQAVIDFYGGVPTELTDTLQRITDEELDANDQARPPLNVEDCPEQPEPPIVPPSMTVQPITPTVTTSTVAD